VSTTWWIKTWIDLIRQHRFWGLSVIAWYLVLHGALLALFFSFWLIGWSLSSPTDALVAFLVGAWVRVTAGIQLRQRRQMGWWLALFVFVWQLSEICAEAIPQVLKMFWADQPDMTPAMRMDEALSLFRWHLPGILWNVLPIVYLVRPKIRDEFRFP